MPLPLPCLHSRCLMVLAGARKHHHHLLPFPPPHPEPPPHPAPLPPPLPAFPPPIPCLPSLRPSPASPLHPPDRPGRLHRVQGQGQQAGGLCVHQRRAVLRLDLPRRHPVQPEEVQGHGAPRDCVRQGLQQAAGQVHPRRRPLRGAPRTPCPPAAPAVLAVLAVPAVLAVLAATIAPPGPRLLLCAHTLPPSPHLPLAPPACLQTEPSTLNNSAKDTCCVGSCILGACMPVEP